jgi:hypothetical protein
MRTCPKCMTENTDTDRFCKDCASPLQQAGGKTCPSGRHTMDPTWTECAYCKQENVVPVAGPTPPVRYATVVEGQMPPRGGQARPLTYKEDTPLPPRPPRPVNVPQSSPAPFPPSNAQQNRPKAQTEYRPIQNPISNSGQAGLTTPAVARDRKVVGVLVSYSWLAEGQVFPIREGRNFIGRDKDCEICILEDQTMSGRNSHITFRQNFVVGDMVSMTGTDVDGVPIEEQFRSLPNYSTIRAGSTYFTFIIIKPAAATEASPKTGS